MRFAVKLHIALPFTNLPLLVVVRAGFCADDIVEV